MIVNTNPAAGTFSAAGCFAGELRKTMDWLKILLGVLCVWRITHLLSAEDGPWLLFVRLRSTLGAGFWGQLIGCFYCLSLYVAAPIAFELGRVWTDRLLLWPALSAGAILLERITEERRSRIEDFYTEDSVKDAEEIHVLR